MSYSHEDRLEQSKKNLEQAQKPEIQMSFTVETSEDERVCPECKKHTGIKMDDVYNAIIGVNHPPFHEGCRCWASYSIEKIRTPEEQEKVKLKIKEGYIQTTEEPPKKSLGMRIIEKLKGH